MTCLTIDAQGPPPKVLTRLNTNPRGYPTALAEVISSSACCWMVRCSALSIIRYALKRYDLSHNRRFSIQEEPRAGRGDFVMGFAIVCCPTGARSLGDLAGRLNSGSRGSNTARDFSVLPQVLFANLDIMCILIPGSSLSDTPRQMRRFKNDWKAQLWFISV